MERNDKLGLVSIITPCYNCANYLQATINSVKTQTYTNWELIFVNDSSTDQTLDILNKNLKEDDRFKLINLPKNQGVANARNVGIEKAKGKYIAFLDADDLWLPEKLRMQVDFMEVNNYEISFTAYKKMNQLGQIREGIISVRKSVCYRKLLYNNVIACSSSMFLKDKFKDITFSKVGHEDFVFWLSILKSGSYAYGLNEPLMIYRISSNSISSNKFKVFWYTWNIYRNVEKINFVRSIFYFIHYAIAGTLKYLK